MDTKSVDWEHVFYEYWARSLVNRMSRDIARHTDERLAALAAELSERAAMYGIEVV